MNPQSTGGLPLGLFIQPQKKRSRAIKIVDPESRKEQVIKHQQAPPDHDGQSAFTFTSAVRDAARAATASAAQKSQTLNKVTAGASTTRLQPDDDELTKGFNVYALPFVPDNLKRINGDAASYVCETPPSSDIDFVGYASSELIANLLPSIPGPSTDPAPAGHVHALTPNEHEAFFRFHLQHEWQYQERENASYSLYQHEGIVEFAQPSPGSSVDLATVTIVVPGLREDSPHVELEDEVELRQLRSDSAQRLILERGYQKGVTWSPLGWTGIVYKARVSAVLRERETLVLRVAGLNIVRSEVMMELAPFVPFPSQHRLKFNVQFPVPKHRSRQMESVLPWIQASLHRASQMTLHARATIDGDNGLELQAAKSAYWIQSMLFPTEADCDIQVNAHSGIFTQRFFDQGLNLEQRISVENVCSQNYGVLPYLISGPPGTGKTKTMVEIALQLIHNVPNVSHILMCAPSEQAADMLADRLRSSVPLHHMLRLNRPSRSFAEVLEGVLPYCHIAGDAFGLPPMEKLMAYKIVVTSCRDAAILMHARVANSDLYAVEDGLRRRIHPSHPPPSQARLHWDALLMDEAAQATEPDALVPLWVVSPPPEAPELVFIPLVVMAGDEQQLNPRTSAPVTILQRSLFARLIARPVYAEHPLARAFKASISAMRNPTSTANPTHAAGDDPPLTITPSTRLPVLRPAFTNLVRNYRSHPAILAVPSALFYHDTLLASAPASSTNRLASWRGWHGRRGWPVLFHDNPSPDDLECDGGGWFNAGEAELACRYAADLVASGLVRQEEVCVMSPFSAQVRLIRRLMRSRSGGGGGGGGGGPSLWGVNVGPTEAFQGLEHGVVILCTTRSRRRFVGRDKALGWGIVGMRNRMNVALTRAKFGLIIIGSREVLAGEDEAWREVIAFYAAVKPCSLRGMF
ncbi:P-loop containing nucleoside triphosphate hydrolase protein [Canariomyces notabilis]|uniref:P-loop containing nucleoside triphosphate hydrolase protein n=1 Tax=Canariomyces notabilis TaxID=2074819 RepID=A0AAN6QF19_9PEZI|nr:P-loop containing nucleoside triphosphate hydrolase protein [Canariomyces arenarius]